MFNSSNITTQHAQPTMDPLMAEMRADYLRMEDIFRKVLIIEGTLSALANLIVILIFMLMGQSGKRFSNYLLFCTALSDLLVSAVSWYSYYVSLLSMQESPHLDDVQLSLHALYDYSFVLSLGTLLVCSFERWFSVSKPLQHQKITNRTFAKIIIVPVWILAALPPLIRLGLADFNLKQFYSSRDRVFNICFRSILIGLILIILIILTMTCIKISTMINRPNGEKQKHLEPGHTHSNEKLIADKANSRVIKIFIIMIIAFAVTFLPITISMFLHYEGALRHMKPTHELALTIFCDVFFFSSSLVNPILTLTCHADYRRSLVNCVTCQKKKIADVDDGVVEMKNNNTEFETVGERQ